MKDNGRKGRVTFGAMSNAFCCLAGVMSIGLWRRLLFRSDTRGRLFPLAALRLATAGPRPRYPFRLLAVADFLPCRLLSCSRVVLLADNYWVPRSACLQHIEDEAG